jgi:hypothetical protein
MDDPATACASEITPMRIGSAACDAAHAKPRQDTATARDARFTNVLLMMSPWKKAAARSEAAMVDARERGGFRDKP